MQPLKLIDEEFDSKKFGGLGYVGVYETSAQAKIPKKGEEGRKEIITWNIYGNVKSNAETFGDVDAYVFFYSFSLCYSPSFTSLDGLYLLEFQAHAITDSSNGAPPSWSSQ